MANVKKNKTPSFIHIQYKENFIDRKGQSLKSFFLKSWTIKELI